MIDQGSEQDHGGPSRSWMSSAGPFLTLGLQLALSVVVMFFLGRWLDQKFGTDPWLMLCGLALGVVGGFVHFFRTAIALGKQEDTAAGERKKEMRRED